MKPSSIKGQRRPAPNPMSQSVRIIVSSDTRIEGHLPFDVWHPLKKRLTFTNPAWIENEKYGYWQGNTPKTLSYISRADNGASTIIPRGFTGQLMGYLSDHRMPYTLEDQTRRLNEVSFGFNGNLYPFQEEAVARMQQKRFGVLDSPTGSGKTVMALYLIARRRQPALVICHTKELLYQWRDRAAEFLDLTPDEIGLIGDGKVSMGEHLTVGIINSVYKRAKALRERVGHLIVDECHRTPSRTFTEAVSTFDSRFMLGLSATPYRRDGLSRLIYFFIGDPVHHITPKTLQTLKRIMKPRLIVRETAFDYAYEDDYQEMVKHLTADPRRNRLIVTDVLKATEGPGISLVISDRKEHSAVLYYLLREKRRIRLLTGDIPGGERSGIIEALQKGEVQILVATAQLIGEGFDFKGLSNIFLTTPVSFTGRVKQYVGRILRTAEGKQEAVIYDYLDKPGVLQASFKSRCAAYWELGIECAEH
ncbi:MAG: DEAD/DEAH box helicase [Deltaproteobacteria bacterium]|nr:DEAD/DEAH box helicase [Deltaproteobacteria bacterium]